MPNLIAKLLSPSLKHGEFGTDRKGAYVIRPAKKGGVLEKAYIGQGKGDVQMWGEADITNGPGKCTVKGCGCGQMHIKIRNKIVNNGLISLANMSGCSNVSNMGRSLFVANSLADSRMLLGTGSGVTTSGQTSLVSAINVSPNSFNLQNSNPSTGIYRTSVTAVWNAGTLSGQTVTEYAVFGGLSTVLSTTLNNSSSISSNVVLTMFARMSVSDSEMSSFVINNANPVTVEYRINWTF